ncbi:MAG: DUF739 family protein [Clostridiales bacterium]|nr:DUF739 family protein [Clostridiales bacterium]
MDANKLRYFIADRGETLSTYEMALGISKTALYRKMKGKTEFTREEIEKTIHFLNLSKEDTMSIFFAQKVS